MNFGAVDGYGFAGGRGEGVHSLPLAAGRAAAGDAPGHVPEGHAMRVLTGAALPEGVDTVVLQEDVVREGDSIRFSGPVKQGANTRKAGEDMREGDTVLTVAARDVEPEGRDAEEEKADANHEVGIEPAVA